ncbi:AAA family ATPase [Eubacteriaceae bacterium ES3]|nr:AAA family ATPase [Eubacteriaceae bacterium ES3]
MKNNQSQLSLEVEQFNTTTNLAKEQLLQARKQNEENMAAIKEAQQEVRENTAHNIGNLWNSDSYEALIELSQTINPINQKLADFEAGEKNIKRLEKIIQNPYFARIDFRFSDQDTANSFYIGQSSLKDEDTYKMYIFDWRSPIASVFYRFSTGPAHYEAPIGTIEGVLSLKRQYEIKDGEFEYYFDSDVQVLDEFLRNLLAQNTAAKMKTIIRSIQKEQDVAIRDLNSQVLIIQGVAGSGKTSIALHRAAYLMYQGLTHKLHARNILIISPNKVFEHYISSVIPDLDEENVVTSVFDEILSLILDEKTIEPKFAYLENLLADHQHRDLMRTSLSFKSSHIFMEILDRLILQIPEKWMKIREIRFKKDCIVSKQEVQRRLFENTDTPLKTRLKYLEEFIDESIFDRRNFHPNEQLMKTLMSFAEFNILSIYQNLFKDKKNFYALSEGLNLPENINAIIARTRDHFYDRVITYDDAAPLAYLYLKINGSNDYQAIRQVIIDEAQDYYPLHFEIMNLLFKKSKLTILGDISQTIEKDEGLDFYHQIEKIFNRNNTTLATMNKSYRCTTEILNFSSKFLNQQIQIESFNRSGDQPQVTLAPNRETLEKLLLAEIKRCLEKDYHSIGLICKTQKNALTLYEILNRDLDLQLIRDEIETELKGIFIMPIYLSKGLEFDAVILCDASVQNYNDPEDKSLLYIACTRALHQLHIFSEGSLSNYFEN